MKPSSSIKFVLSVFCAMLIVLACQTPKQVTKGYPRMIGDIKSDPSIDSPDFELCKSEKYTVQYYGFTSEEGSKPHLNEKYEVEKLVADLYIPDQAKKESGLLRIRFIVNCKGEAGRFRILGMDKYYNEKIFDKSISDQLLNITKKHFKWKAFKTEKFERDYYMYVIFKIEEGEVLEIMP